MSGPPTSLLDKANAASELDLESGVSLQVKTKSMGKGPSPPFENTKSSFNVKVSPLDGLSGTPSTPNGRKSLMLKNGSSTARPAIPNKMSASLDKKIAKVPRDGTYTLSHVLQQPPRPYVYIPQSALESPTFSFDEIFSELGLKTPAIIFRMCRAKDPAEWNFRLPKARMHLKEIYEMLYPELIEKGSDAEAEFLKKLAKKKYNKEKEEKKEEHSAEKEEKKIEQALLKSKDDFEGGNGGEEGVEARIGHMDGLFSEIEKAATKGNESGMEGGGEGSNYLPGHTVQPYDLEEGMPIEIDVYDSKAGKHRTVALKNPQAVIKHYHGVLRENCRRLLRGTYAACDQAGAAFRIHDIWTDDIRDDVVSEWITENGRDPDATLLSVGDISSLHPKVWDQLDAGAKPFEKHTKDKDMKTNDRSQVEIDTEPFFRDNKEGEEDLEYEKSGPEYKLVIDPRTNTKVGSFPHPSATHLILTDNLLMLESKLLEYVPWGLILINGGKLATTLMIDCIQNGRPMIAIKYTGGAADLACEMLENRALFLRAKKLNMPRLPEKPFPDDMKEFGTWRSDWFMPFDEIDTYSAEQMNVLIENWPDRFNPSSVFMVDIFTTTEDEVQDRITQTMGVVFEAAHELGGSQSEQRRLTYAWRVRHKFIYNAWIYKLISDFLMMLITVFTTFSTGSAVLSSYFELNSGDLGSEYAFTFAFLQKANLLLPLIATIFRGIYAAVSPMLKYVALKNASVQVEGEIYMYRTKVGKYGRNPKKSPLPEEAAAAGDGASKKRETKQDKMNPRRAFSAALDQIWKELSSSDIQNGSLRPPIDTTAALNDINARIAKNRSEQDSYITLLKMGETEKKAKKKNAKGTKSEDEKLEEDLVKFIADTNAAMEEAKIAARDLKWYEKIGDVIFRSICCCIIFAVEQTKRTAAMAATMLPLNAVPVPKDDGLRALSADDYVKIRLLPMAATFSKKAPSLATTVQLSAIIGVLLSVGSSILSTFELSVFIPAALALSGSITALNNYYQNDLRLLQTNSALNQLNMLLVWWDGLTMIEKRVPNNKETLVKTTEACIQAQATIFSGGSANKDDEGEEDQEEEGEEKKKK